MARRKRKTADTETPETEDSGDMTEEAPEEVEEAAPSPEPEPPKAPTPKPAPAPQAASEQLLPGDGEMCKAIANYPMGCQAQTLALRYQMPLPTVYTILGKLVRLGHARRDGNTFTLTPSGIQLAHPPKGPPPTRG